MNYGKIIHNTPCIYGQRCIVAWPTLLVNTGISTREPRLHQSVTIVGIHVWIRIYRSYIRPGLLQTASSSRFGVCIIGPHKNYQGAHRPSIAPYADGRERNFMILILAMAEFIKMPCVQSVNPSRTTGLFISTL